jgi:hypothetical protein
MTDELYCNPLPAPRPEAPTAAAATAVARSVHAATASTDPVRPLWDSALDRKLGQCGLALVGNRPRRHAHDGGAGAHVLGDHGARSDERARPHVDAPEHDRARP